MEYREPAGYDGPFVELVERVVPTVTPLIGDDFSPRTVLARGKAIQRTLARMDIISAVPP